MSAHNVLLLCAASLLQRLASGLRSYSAWHASCFTPLPRIQVRTCSHAEQCLTRAGPLYDEFVMKRCLYKALLVVRRESPHTITAGVDALHSDHGYLPAL